MKTMIRNESREKCGQLPNLELQVEGGHLFSIRWESETLYYETKWGPNIEVITAIADHFKVGYSLSFEESNMLVFGDVNYESGILTIYQLDSEDYDLFEFDEENEHWIFEGGTYDHECLIMEILLERKKATPPPL